MTLEEKKQALAQEEWEQFQQVQNEGGRASCQDDPDTFFRMRRSQFAPWPEELVDAYAADLRSARAVGRNLLTEKYAWMMERTAPERFRRISPLLPPPSELSERLIERVVELQLPWMEEYREKYPRLSAGNRPTRSSQDGPWSASFETYLRGELHTYSERTLLLYLDFLKELKAEGKNLSLLIMESTVRSYGYRDLEDAEKRIQG